MEISQERRIKHILSSSPTVIYTCDVGGNYDLSFVSENVTRYFGYTPDEIMNKENFWRDVVHPDDHIKVFNGCKDFFSNGHEIHEYRFQKKDGGYVWVHDEMRLIRDDNGNPLEIVGSWLDISDRKATEAALQKSEALFRAFFDSNPVATIITSPAGTVHMVNPAFLKGGGYKTEQIVGRTAQEIGFWRRPEDRERLVSAILEHGYVDNLESVFADQWGNEKICLVSSRAVDFENEMRILNIVVDITETRKAEDALKKSEQLFRDFFQANPVPTIISDPDGTVNMINPAFTLNPGYTAEEVVGRKVQDLGFWRIPKDRDRMVDAIKEHGYIDNLESEFYGKGKRPMTCLISSRSIEYEGKRKILSIVTDITELRKAEAEKKKLETAKRDFISTVAHELRTPLIAVVGYCELLENAATMNLSDEQKNEYLGIIQSNAEVLNCLVDDLLDVGRIQIGRSLGISCKETELLPLINKTVASSSLKSGRHEIIIEQAAGVPQNIWIDSGRIAQVLYNLLNNAIKYSPGGGIVKVRVARSSNYVDISVADNGVGMTTEQVENIFDRFYRVVKENSDSPGLGLGMSIVKQIIADHDGRIDVQSEVGQGTTVTFSLPVRA